MSVSALDRKVIQKNEDPSRHLAASRLRALLDEYVDELEVDERPTAESVRAFRTHVLIIVEHLLGVGSIAAVPSRDRGVSCTIRTESGWDAVLQFAPTGRTIRSRFVSPEGVAIVEEIPVQSSDIIRVIGLVSS